MKDYILGIMSIVLLLFICNAYQGESVYGELYVNSATAISISEIGTYYKLVGFEVDGFFHNCIYNRFCFIPL